MLDDNFLIGKNESFLASLLKTHFNVAHSQVTECEKKNVRVCFLHTMC